MEIIAVDRLPENPSSPLYRCANVIIREENWDDALADTRKNDDAAGLEDARYYWTEPSENYPPRPPLVGFLDSHGWFCEIKFDDKGRYLEIQGNDREEEGGEDVIFDYLSRYFEPGAEIHFFDGFNLLVFRDGCWHKAAIA